MSCPPTASGRAAKTKKKTALLFSEREDNHAIAALEVDLRVAAAAHGDILLAADHVGDRLRVGAGAAVEAPQLLAGRRVERVEAAVTLTEEEQAARGGQAAADQRLLGIVLPGHLAGVDIDGRDAAPLLLARDNLERAAEPHLRAAGILRRLDVIGHRLVQVERDGEPVLRLPCPRRPPDAEGMGAQAPALP